MSPGFLRSGLALSVAGTFFRTGLGFGVCSEPDGPGSTFPELARPDLNFPGSDFPDFVALFRPPRPEGSGVIFPGMTACLASCPSSIESFKLFEAGSGISPGFDKFLFELLPDLGVGVGVGVTVGVGVGVGVVFLSAVFGVFVSLMTFGLEDFTVKTTNYAIKL